ncbi:hypothetical protein N7449_011961 [Penicillium cf. viridicatum]|uniref:Uncharacterized protein n=1 Tax=Penicillium cf. viridicatum TaxID=2972119 RepID=A0A9W9IMP6_9EURO|nr:hypothetical protein N7449_011961 [Penicillium cf. viridicatum]
MRRDGPSGQPLSATERMSVRSEVHRWVRELPTFDRVKLAGRAIAAVACLVNNLNTQYLYPHMKRTWLYAGLAPSSRDNINFWALYDWFEAFDHSLSMLNSREV